jgi:hypothetical protein
MKRTLAIIITSLSAVMAFLYWGDPMSYGWICAAAGWIGQCFKDTA